ncbi:probable LRR receptor-like serine/threonine-protein kinase At2g16250 [Phoenix dactylifera]|uniref:Probable LRR receptor-like serine/threonine-protein kinase At2g16250 n=1 Tax=Phoenix dactylifera TaxID=42345 RepID=A0A8B7BX95_PHODC|nr:probable LRR receptor-like serine/threonine-protein kinase At2g16250 [Phoenix dactylifera]
MPAASRSDQRMSSKSPCTPMRSPSLMVILFSLLFVLQRVGLARCQPLSSAVELGALYSLRSSLGLRARDWPRRADPCSAWTGVRCRSGRVFSLNISGLRRTRVARRNPRFAVDGLQNLTSLVSFNASGFRLSGPIPDWFGTRLPPSLAALDLRSAAVFGAIPYSLGGAAGLSVLSLAGNALTGDIPPTLGGLRRLTHLDLSRNVLTGSVPAALAALANLSHLDLSSNHLAGEIPPALGSLSNLKTLILSNNSLTGSVPPQLGNLSFLVSLDLSFNSLLGSLPESLFSGASRLRSVVLRRNNFSGALPDSLWSLLPVLELLDVSSNNLTGEFPNHVPVNANARDGLFNLSNNLYYGSISSGFEILFQRFKFVDLSYNYFEGTASSTNASLAMNCFQNASNQRSTAECEKFYMERGIAFDGGTVPPASSPSGNRNWRYILAGVLGGLAFILMLVSVLVLFLVRRGVHSAERRGVTANVAPSGRVAQEPPSSGASVELSSVGDAFTYEQLLQATSEFSPLNLVKHGHSGDLYYGVLEDGASVVIKKIDAQTLNREAYVMELNLFARVSHARLVPFLGHCLEKEDEKLLVYKHMPIGDLSSALHRKPGREEEGLQPLDWIKRLKIAIGVAEALCFLHHECTPPLVHRDVQASSILLDDKYEVRLGSLSEVCTQQGDGQQKVFTSMLRSSQPSEQGISGFPGATCAYDVCCFGKVLLELVTGKLGISGSDGAGMNDWLDHTLSYISLYEKELVTKIMDPNLVVDEDHLEEVWAMAIVAKSCLDPKPSKRPLARYILKALENPLKVVREESHSNSSRLRTTSSLGSWRSALFVSWRNSSSDLTSLKYSATARSQGSGGDRSFSCRRTSRDIFPEPLGLAGEFDE